VAPRYEDPKLIIRAINFELVQPIFSQYLNVTNGQTDGRFMTSVPRFAALHNVHRAEKHYAEIMFLIRITVIEVICTSCTYVEVSVSYSQCSHFAFRLCTLSSNVEDKHSIPTFSMDSFF